MTPARLLWRADGIQCAAYLHFCTVCITELDIDMQRDIQSPLCGSQACVVRSPPPKAVTAQLYRELHARTLFVVCLAHT